jgi:hypothetical protein
MREILLCQQQKQIFCFSWLPGRYPDERQARARGFVYKKVPVFY